MEIEVFDEENVERPRSKRITSKEHRKFHKAKDEPKRKTVDIVRMKEEIRLQELDEDIDLYA